jgi:hypothetical protein
MVKVLDLSEVGSRLIPHPFIDPTIHWAGLS